LQGFTRREEAKKPQGNSNNLDIENQLECQNRKNQDIESQLECLKNPKGKVRNPSCPSFSLQTVS
jgi:hypothetical protein